MSEDARYRKVDLHSHSSRSDGRLSPADLVSLAAEQEVSLFALTDHDTLDGITEARQKAKDLGISFVNGVELSTQWKGIPLHMVALNFAQDNPAVLSVVEKNQLIRLDRDSTYCGFTGETRLT
ncbi:PHP domain-containing protein [Marinomonas sp. GJ51-6]|uniref:PHP domain-containing protein n=1 Tax=Marinomonas sp. GJ51-6 TaxID=2992802 RepID=UPI002934B7D8|nr:PHP domain-containing protein [Marinomonas sp. GJ51-6]WOD06606.1 PHP domain-containing protein [Marinomonas sp. GJ51-6]